MPKVYDDDNRELLREVRRPQTDDPRHAEAAGGLLGGRSVTFRRGRRARAETTAADAAVRRQGNYYMLRVWPGATASSATLASTSARPVEPSRTEGTPSHSDALKQLEVILNLTRDLGVNLAGIEIILNMRRKMEQMQSDLNEFLGHVREELRRSREDGWQDKLEQALVKVPPAMIVKAPPDKP